MKNSKQETSDTLPEQTTQAPKSAPSAPKKPVSKRASSEPKNQAQAPQPAPVSQLPPAPAPQPVAAAHLPVQQQQYYQYYGGNASQPLSWAPNGTPHIGKPSLLFDKLDRIAAMFAFFAGFLFIRYFLWNVSGYYTTASVIVVLGLTVAFLIKKGHKLTFFNWVNALTILMFSFIFSFTADNYIKFWTFMICCAAMGYLVFAVCSRKKFSEFFARDQANAVFHPILGLGYIFRSLSRKNQKEKTQQKTNTFGAVVLGLVAAIPLFFMVAILLTAADQAMADIMENFWRNLAQEIFSLTGQAVLAIPVAMYMFGMIYINSYQKKKDEITDEVYKSKNANLRVFANAGLYAMVTPVIVLYFVFFFSQMPYYLSGFSGALPGGYTYSQYAVRGFNELLFLAVINLVIIIAFNTFAKKCRDEKTPALKIYTVFLSLSTLVLVAVSFSKLYIYILEFGITRLRVLSAWSMAVIGIVFLIIILKQFIDKLPAVRAVVVCMVLMFAVLAFGRIDRQIARINIEMYKAGYHKDLDVKYLVFDLNHDGLLYIVENGEIATLENAQSVFIAYHINVKEAITHRICVDGETGERYNYCNKYDYYNMSSGRLRRLLEPKY